MKPNKSNRATQSKDKILKAAFELMIKNGVARTSVQDVAKKSKTSHPLVTYHFKDLDALYMGVLQSILEEMRLVTIKSIEASCASESERLKNYSSCLFNWGKNNEDKIRLWMYFYYLASFHEEYKKFNNEIRKAGRERIMALLTKGIALGEFPTVSAKVLDEKVYAIQSALTGNLVMCISESGYSFKEAAQITENQIAAIALKV